VAASPTSKSPLSFHGVAKGDRAKAPTELNHLRPAWDTFMLSETALTSRSVQPKAPGPVPCRGSPAWRRPGHLIDVAAFSEWTDRLNGYRTASAAGKRVGQTDD
jgi:hypothetical protein